MTNEHIVMKETVSIDVKKTFFQHLMGPRGGVFAFGMMVGAIAMFFFMNQVVMKTLDNSSQARINALESRVEYLENENKRLNARIEDFIFKKIEE